MTQDGLVEVPENAFVEERIAFGLTAPQLAIVTGAALFAAALNLLSLWAPVRLLLIALVSGPVVLAAVLRIRGEPAYRWLLRAVRHWRSPKVWQAEVQAFSKPPVSGVVQHLADDHAAGAAPQDGPPPVRQGTTLRATRSGAVQNGADNAGTATTELAAPFSPPSLAAREASAAEEQVPMDGSPARLRLLTPQETGSDSEEAARREEPEQPPSIPYVLPGPRVACFLSFAGGVGKTTLAVEAASLLATRARYRSADGAAHRLRVLLVDAARPAPAAGLRLGIEPDALSEARRHRDWTAPDSVAASIAPTSHRLDLLSLPPDPILAGRVGADGGDPLRFGPPAAVAILRAAHAAPYQLVVVDLGSGLEEGHQHLLDKADVVIGVVRPTLESIPDVVRLAERLRGALLGGKLLLVANHCEDDAELRSFAREVDVPLIGAIPPTPAFTAAADRQRPAWTDDLSLYEALRPVAAGLWPFDPLGGADHQPASFFERWLARIRGAAPRNHR